MVDVITKKRKAKKGSEPTKARKVKKKRAGAPERLVVKKVLPVEEVSEKKLRKASELADEARKNMKKRRFKAAYKGYMKAVKILPEHEETALEYRWHAGMALFKLATYGKKEWVDSINHFLELSNLASAVGKEEISEHAMYYGTLALIYAKLGDAENFAGIDKYTSAIKTCKEAYDILEKIPYVDIPLVPEEVLDILIRQKALSYKIKNFRRVELIGQKTLGEPEKQQKFREKRYKVWYAFEQLCMRDLKKIGKLPLSFETFETKRNVIANEAESLRGLYLASPHTNTEFLKAVLSMYKTAASMSKELYEGTENPRYMEEGEFYGKKAKEIESDIEEFKGTVLDKIFQKDMEELATKVWAKEQGKVELEEEMTKMESYMQDFPKESREKVKAVDDNFRKKMDEKASELGKTVEHDRDKTLQAEIEQAAKLLKMIEEEQY